jgi:hypothetical protein
MSHVTLERALRLVLLMGAEEDPKFERVAGRFVERFIREQRPRMLQIKKLADALHCLRYDGFLGIDSKAALEDLANRLSESGDSSRWNPPE